MKILLLDFGSSFIKYSFYDTQTKINTETFSLSFPQPIVDEDDRYEVENTKIDKALWKIMDEAELNECTAAFICVQMHGYLLKHQGKFSNYISWKDKRGKAYLDSYKEKALYDNGTVYKANSPRVSLRDFPSLKDREFFTLGSYISYLLTGQNITHITDACASGLFRVDTCASDNPFEGLNIPKAITEMRTCGKYNNIDIYPPIGDHQVSFLGAGAQYSDAVLNLGTAAQLSIIVNEDAPRFEGIEYRPYFVKGQRIATLSGVRGSDIEGILSRIKSSANAFGKTNHILISGGGAKDKYDVLANELSKLGYKVEQCYQNVGNEGLKRIADNVYPMKGTMLSEVGFINFPFVLKKSEMDFFIIDNEHGNFENKTIMSLAMNSKHANIQTIVRLPNNDRSIITKLADGGVTGFLLPMTNRKEDIEKVIEYSKYSPVGKRGISTTRVHTEYGVSDIKEYMKYANQKMKIYAQIETRSGIENIDEILNVSGVDGVFIGPNDLSCDYECIGNKEKIKELISEISRACIKHNKPCGIITTDTDLIKHALISGCSLISYGSEINMLINGAKDITNKRYL